MKKLYIDAGHFDWDNGAVIKGRKEHELNKQIRDCLKAILTGYETHYVPDSLSLKDTIEWINNDATYENFAVSIHLNNNADSSIRGTEAYYTEKMKYSDVFARCVSEKLIIPNRGSKHDSQTAVGSLGFLRKLRCPSVVIEVCYMSNEEDMKAFEPMKAAIGIKNAIEELFPLPKKVEEVQQKQIGLLRLLIEKLLALIGILKKRL